MNRRKLSRRALDAESRIMPDFWHRLKPSKQERWKDVKRSLIEWSLMALFVLGLVFAIGVYAQK